MQNRLARIIKPKSGRCVMLAVDHGYFGNIPGFRHSNCSKSISGG